MFTHKWKWICIFVMATAIIMALLYTTLLRDYSLVEEILLDSGNHNIDEFMNKVRILCENNPPPRAAYILYKASNKLLSEKTKEKCYDFREGVLSYWMSHLGYTSLPYLRLFLRSDNQHKREFALLCLRRHIYFPLVFRECEQIAEVHPCIETRIEAASLLAEVSFSAETSLLHILAESDKPDTIRLAFYSVIGKRVVTKRIVLALLLLFTDSDLSLNRYDDLSSDFRGYLSNFVILNGVNMRETPFSAILVAYKSHYSSLVYETLLSQTEMRYLSSWYYSGKRGHMPQGWLWKAALIRSDYGLSPPRRLVARLCTNKAGVIFPNEMEKVIRLFSRKQKEKRR